MANNKRALLNSILRQDLSRFIHRSFQTVVPGEVYSDNWHIQAIAWRLEQCLRGDIRRLIITMPPRSLKSICTSVAFPAWALGHDPALKIICASYSSDLTMKHARDCRAVMESDWYKRAFRKTRLHPKKNTEIEFMTNRRGFRLGTSVGGTLTGKGGNLIIIDDPLKPGEAMSDVRRESVKQWFDGTLYSRLDNKSEDRIILVMQRLHTDDLAGHLLEKGGWDHLNLPAIAEAKECIASGDGQTHIREPGDLLHPERENRRTLDETKSTVGTYNFSSQYQQAPIPPEGNFIQWKWFKRYQDLPDRKGQGQILQSWDTASKPGEKNDYSVCTTWLFLDKDFYLIDVLRAHLNYPDLKRRIISHAQKFSVDSVLIEDSASGIQLIQDLRSHGTLRPIGIAPEGDKVTRLISQSARIEAGYVHLPENARWLPDFEREVLQFPNARYDDQVDSMSQALAWAKDRGNWIIEAGGTRLSAQENWGYWR